LKIALNEEAPCIFSLMQVSNANSGPEAGEIPSYLEREKSFDINKVNTLS